MHPRNLHYLYSGEALFVLCYVSNGGYSFSLGRLELWWDLDPFNYAFRWSCYFTTYRKYWQYRDLIWVETFSRQVIVCKNTLLWESAWRIQLHGFGRLCVQKNLHHLFEEGVDFIFSVNFAVIICTQIKLYTNVILYFQSVKTLQVKWNIKRKKFIFYPTLIETDFEISPSINHFAILCIHETFKTVNWLETLKISTIQVK